MCYSDHLLSSRIMWRPGELSGGQQNTTLTFLVTFTCLYADGTSFGKTLKKVFVYIVNELTFLGKLLLFCFIFISVSVTDLMFAIFVIFKLKRNL